MSPVGAAMLGGAVTAGYIPFLRKQIRNGDIGLPFGTINPIRIGRDAHPAAFRLATWTLIALVTLLIGACALILLQALVS